MNILKFLLFVGLVVVFTGCPNSGSDSDSDSDSSSQVPPEETITHNGVTYSVVTSDRTGKQWLDRNLGASRVCESKDDTQCYGDYYQWGRATDGHEKKDSTLSSGEVAVVDNAGETFIVGSGDWTSVDTDGSIRSANWQKTDGSNVCPEGFRVPSVSELFSELPISTPFDDSAFATQLKLPIAGARLAYDLTTGESAGDYVNQGGTGYYWSYEPDDNTTASLAKNVTFSGGSLTNSSPLYKSLGLPVRCIKD